MAVDQGREGTKTGHRRGDGQNRMKTMENRTTDLGKRQKRFMVNKKLLFQLTIGGGVAFWLTSIATSLLPIAAAYRAAFSNWSRQTVWVASLFLGILIGCCVSYLLLRFFEKIPVKGPILKSLILSFIALAMAVILIDVPMFFQEPSASYDYLLIGVMFNTVRFLILGFVVGHLYKRLFMEREHARESI
jgi:Na+/phosphate symporter